MMRESEYDPTILWGSVQPVAITQEPSANEITRFVFSPQLITAALTIPTTWSLMWGLKIISNVANVVPASGIFVDFFTTFGTGRAGITIVSPRLGFTPADFQLGTQRWYRSLREFPVNTASTADRPQIDTFPAAAIQCYARCEQGDIGNVTNVEVSAFCAPRVGIRKDVRL
jgi:hypothetical protein